MLWETMLPDSELPPSASTTEPLALAIQEAATEWKNDLQALFHDAKNRFSDIVWVTSDEKEAVWGHKAIVYARNSKGSFIDYTYLPNGPFNVRFRPVHSPSRKFNLLNESLDRIGLDEPYPSRQDSQSKGALTDKTKPDAAERKITVLESTSSQVTRVNLIPKVLSLYTVENGPGIPMIETQNEKSTEYNDHDLKLNLCRNDLMISIYRDNLVAVWKDKMHTDIQVNVRWFGQEAIKHRETSVYRFSTHRCILATRSPVLRDILMGKAAGQYPSITLKTTDKGLVLTLPYPSFTPSSFFCVLGYMYSGTIYFRNNRPGGLSFKYLTTAFEMIRSSIFLGMPTLQQLLVAHIVVKVVHGLFHAYLEDEEYGRLVGTNWSRMIETRGCECVDCVTRVPRVLQFALESDVCSDVLQRGARRALLGTFGLGWCSHDFASLSRIVRMSILTDMLKMVTPENVLPLLLAAQQGLDKLDEATQSWDLTVRTMILTVREKVDEMLCKKSRACFDSEKWRSIISMDSVVRKDQLVRLIMRTVLRATQAQQPFYITSVYQTIDSLEIPDIPRNFFVRTIVEHTKSKLLGKIAMLSSSVLSLSTHVSFVTAEEEFADAEGSFGQSHRGSPSIISNNGRSSSQAQPYASSIYSDISYQTVPLSITESRLHETSPWSLNAGEVEWDDSRSETNRMLALDLAAPSIYSRASSRTLSTDYGLFYTRRAIWSTSTFSLRREIVRRNSWDSLISSA